MAKAKFYGGAIGEYSIESGLPLWELSGFNSAEACIEHIEENLRQDKEYFAKKMLKYHLAEQGEP